MAAISFSALSAVKMRWTDDGGQRDPVMAKTALSKILVKTRASPIEVSIITELLLPGVSVHFRLFSLYPLFPLIF